MADNDKKKKPQTPGGGKPRKDAAPAKGPAAPAATGGQVNIYANDPESSGMQPLVPGPGYTDHRPKMYKGGSAQTFVNGHGLDMGPTENRNFVAEVNRHERAMFRRRANAEQEESDRASRQAREQRYRESQARRNQERLDRNFERGVFSTREGWANLGRAKGVDAEGKEVVYGRGAAGVKDYDKRYAELKRRADILTKAFESGDFTGRGKEWAAIRKEVAKTHEGGGLTEKQLEGIEKKMDAMRDGLNERADNANRLQAFYNNKSLQEQRQKLGDAYGLLSDEQVKAMSDKKKWDNVRKASDAYLASVNQRNPDGTRKDPDTVETMGFDQKGSFGVTSRGGDRVQAMQDLLDNGISLTQLARMAVQSGDKKWTGAYDKIMASNEDSAKRDRAVESLGHAYLRSMLDKGDEGIKALTAGIEAENTVTGKAKKQGPNKLLSWDDAPAEPAASTTPNGTSATTPGQRASEQERRDALPAQSKPESSPKNWDTGTAELAKPLQERQTVESNDGGQTLPVTAEEFNKIQNTPLKSRGELLPKPTQEQIADQLGSVVSDVLKPRKKPEDE